MNEQTKQFLAGVRAEAPLLIAVFPFGMIYGALALNAGLSQPRFTDDVLHRVRGIVAVRCRTTHP